MMKRFYCAFLALLQSAFLLSHGFSANTLVLLVGSGWQAIETPCYSAQKKKISIASYDTSASFQTTASIIRGGRSKTNCYIQFGFDGQCKDSHYDAIACTPMQEFYLAATRQWMPAHMLNVGDELLCASSTKAVAYVALINEPLDIYTIEIKRTHTFFVTQHSILTHNMVLPLAFNIGLSIPFGVSAGGAAGSFFGPATFVVGAVAGCMVGAFFKILYDGHIPRYAVDEYNAPIIEQQMQQQVRLYESQITSHVNYVNEQFSDLPTSEEICSVVSPDGDENKPSYSITIFNQSKETPGCIPGEVELFENPGYTIVTESPLILVTPAEPMPFFQNPGCGGEIPAWLSGRGSTMLFAEGITIEEMSFIIEDLKKNAQPGEKTKGKTDPYVVDGTYNDAVEKFNELKPQNVKTINDGGKAGFVGDLADGRTANVRTDSTHGSPTLEIYNPSNGKKLKFRYIGS